MTKPATAEAAVGIAPARAEHRLIPLAQLRESPLNHRRTWGDMDELTESVRRQGVLQPVLARPTAGGAAEFELVFGHRRYRAAKKAGLADLPAMVRSMTDVEVLEAQVVENVQRADVHPLEEAEGYEQLLKQKEKAYTVDDIAAKVGKSKAYVYGRLKLVALCPDARKAFYAGLFTASVALLIARMPADLQVKALKQLEQRRYDGEPVSFRYAAETIHRGFMLDLAGAAFDRADAALVPAAGACSTCPKRSGANPDLFGDVESGDVCSDPTCFQTKTDATWKLKAEAARAAGRQVLAEKEAKEVFDGYSHRPKYQSSYVDLTADCERDPKRRSYAKLLGKHAAEVVVLAKDGAGNIHELLPKAAVGKLLKEAGHDFKAERSAASGRTPAEKAANAKEAERRAVEEEVGKRAAARFGNALDTREPDREIWDCAIGALLATMYDDADQVLERRFGAEDAEKALQKARPKMTAAQLRAVFLDLHLSTELGAFKSPVSARLFKWAKVDVKKLEAEVRAERKAAAAKPKEPLDGLVGSRADAVKRHKKAADHG